MVSIALLVLSHTDLICVICIVHLGVFQVTMTPLLLLCVSLPLISATVLFELENHDGKCSLCQIDLCLDSIKKQKIIIHLIYIALFKILKDPLQVACYISSTVDSATGSNSGLSVLLKDTSTRAGIEPQTR